MSSDYKLIPRPLLTGPLDVRTPLSEYPESSFRYRQNFIVKDDAGKLFRMAGFEKLLSRDSFYGNADFHDQLLPLQQYYKNKTPKPDGADDTTNFPNSTLCGSELFTRTQGRERITLQFEFTAQNGARKLIIGTQSRIALQNINTRNWRILADGMGGKTDSSLRTRFKAASLNDTVFFTNDADAPVYWNKNDTAQGCEMQSVKKVPDLVTIGLTKARVVISYKGMMLLMNVEMDGVRYGNRVVNSDENNPIGFDPATGDSITGYTTLPSSAGEKILGAMLLQDDLVVFTDKGNYLGQATGNPDAPLEFVKHYGSPDGIACLFYENTLVSDGSTIKYLGRDSLYSFSPYRRDPETVDWIHPCAGAIFNGVGDYAKINSDNCACHVAGYDSANGKMWFSWAEEGSNIPGKSLVLDTKLEFSSLTDVGFTAFCNFSPDYRQLLRDWLLQSCSCNISDMASLNLRFIKEAQPVGFCEVEPGNEGNDAIPPSRLSIYTDEEGETYGEVTEDWTLPTSDETSFCAMLNGQFASDLCGGCTTPPLFIGAYSGDWCLKQIGTAYSREVCTNPTDESTSPANNLAVQKYYSFTGEYEIVGYDSIIRSGPQNYGTLQFEKNISAILLEIEAEAQVEPCVVSFRVGSSYSARDPNVEDCGIIWSDPVNRFFQCPQTKTATQHKTDNTRDDEGLRFPFFVSAKYLYWEMKISSLSNQDSLTSTLTPGIGGAGSVGLLTTKVRQAGGGRQ
jgi:hypothetical protein